MTPITDRLRQRIMDAAERADWIQVVLNQGPPCFHLEEDSGKFCLRAQRWAGHTDKDEYPEHRFVSLAALVAALTPTPAPQEETSGPSTDGGDTFPAPLPSEADLLRLTKLVRAALAEGEIAWAKASTEERLTSLLTWIVWECKLQGWMLKNQNVEEWLQKAEQQLVIAAPEPQGEGDSCPALVPLPGAATSMDARPTRPEGSQATGSATEGLSSLAVPDARAEGPTTTCTGEPLTDGGLPADGVIYPGDPAHCDACAVAAPGAEDAIHLLAEWDAEVKEHGIWTSGHSIAARMANLLKSGASAPAAGSAQPLPCPHCGLFGNHLSSCEYEKFTAMSKE